MTIRKLRSPTMTVIQASSFSITEGIWTLSSGKVHSPPINGEIVAIAASFNSNDTDASLNIATRDLASTNICKITDWSTNKAAAIRYPQFFPTSYNTSTLVNTIAAMSGGIGIPRPIADSIQISVTAGTSGDTAICEIFYRV